MAAARQVATPASAQMSSLCFKMTRFFRLRRAPCRSCAKARLPVSRRRRRRRTERRRRRPLWLRRHCLLPVSRVALAGRTCAHAHARRRAQGAPRTACSAPSNKPLPMGPQRPAARPPRPSSPKRDDGPARAGPYGPLALNCAAPTPTSATALSATSLGSEGRKERIRTTRCCPPLCMSARKEISSSNARFTICGLDSSYRGTHRLCHICSIEVLSSSSWGRATSADADAPSVLAPRRSARRRAGARLCRPLTGPRRPRPLRRAAHELQGRRGHLGLWARRRGALLERVAPILAGVRRRDPGPPAPPPA